MREIGGYFGLEYFSGKEYYRDLIAVNSGRNAALYIIKCRGYRKLYIPCFLCDAIREMCRRECVEFEEYAIDSDFQPVFDKTLAADEALYVVNYYGQISNEKVLELKNRWCNIIFDNVQAFFQRPVLGVDTVYSCRKFFGVPDGGYAACDGVALTLETDSSRGRMAHILGRCEESGFAFYKAFQQNEEGFYEMPLRRMSLLTQNILRGIDYDFVRRRRNDNYELLAQAFDKRNALKLIVPDGPYCYPFYCENGMMVKQTLVQKGIYVPTLWPNVLKLEGRIEKNFVENVLPLPCDQRYNAEDIGYLINAVMMYMH